MDYTQLSDSDLDSAYAAAFAAGDSQAYTAAGVVIVDRLASMGGFVTSLFGHPFPQFTAIQASGKTTAGFVSTDVAKQAVVTSSGNIIAAAENAAKFAGVGMIVAAVAAVAVLYFWKKK